MLIYDRFVFLHMPKTAEKFLRQALEDELGPPRHTASGHPGWDSIPPEATTLPVLMYVRNPWDWYVSWYHFYPRWLEERRSPEWLRENDLHLRALFGDDIEIEAGRICGIPDFATTMRNVCENLGPRNPVVRRMLAERSFRVESVATDDDLCTAEFKRMAGGGLGASQLTVGRFESLLEDLERFFNDQRIPLGRSTVRRIAAHEPVNTGAHLPYREYYDDDLRDLVGRRCRMLLERFGYRF